MANRYSNEPVYSDSQGEVTNPTAAGAAVADTGAIGNALGTQPAGGVYEVDVTAASSVAGKFVVQRRNAANTATVGDPLPFYTVANQTVALPFKFELLNGERFRVMMLADLTGTVVVTITAQRVG